MDEKLIFAVGLIIGILISIIILIFFVYKIKRIQEFWRNQIDKKEKEFQLRESEIRKNSVKRSRSGLKGKLGEQFIPLMGAKFRYVPSDARFVGDPIDYIIFDNYTNVKEGINDDPVTIVIAEIKTGKSGLKKYQNRIKDAVKEGRVKWDLISLQLSEEESKDIIKPITKELNNKEDLKLKNGKNGKSKGVKKIPKKKPGKKKIKPDEVLNWLNNNGEDYDAFEDSDEYQEF